jgi:hypothetical protein
MNSKLSYLLCFLVIGLASCLHKDFDEPPIGGGDDMLPEVNATISELKQLYEAGELTKILSEVNVKGEVIANDRSGNYFKTIVIQDHTGGIDVKINSVGLFAEFPIGQEIVIKCKDLYISDFNNLLQLGSVYDDNGTLRLGGIEEALINQHIFKGENIGTPAVKLKGINDLTEVDISTLIRLEGVQFTDEDKGQTYADASRRFSLNRALEDCNDNSIILRSSGYADFASELTPTGNGSITAVYSVYQNTSQLWIRDVDDLNMPGKRCDDGGGGGGGSNPVAEVNENFETQSNDRDINLPGWSNVAVSGTRLWRAKEFDGNTYAQATAFNDNNPTMEAWLITPLIDLDQVSSLSFETAKAFYNHDGLTIWISTDYDEINPESASWLPLTARIANNSDPDHDWIPSGSIDLRAFSGEGYIGFKYSGSASNSTSYRIDNVEVK